MTMSLVCVMKTRIVTHSTQEPNLLHNLATVSQKLHMWFYDLLPKYVTMPSFIFHTSAQRQNMMIWKVMAAENKSTDGIKNIRCF